MPDNEPHWLEEDEVIVKAVDECNDAALAMRGTEFNQAPLLSIVKRAHAGLREVLRIVEEYSKCDERDECIGCPLDGPIEGPNDMGCIGYLIETALGVTEKK